MQARVIISWLPPERDGRRTPPPAVFRTVGRFEGDVRDTEGLWSVVVYDAVPLGKPLVVRATLEIVVKDAPSMLIDVGQRFQILEGKVVGKGIVVAPDLLIPPVLSEFELALLG